MHVRSKKVSDLVGKSKEQKVPTRESGQGRVTGNCFQIESVVSAVSFHTLKRVCFWCSEVDVSHPAAKNMIEFLTKIGPAGKCVGDL